MQCEECKIEMYMNKKVDDCFEFVCKQCNKVIKKTENELKKEYERLNS